MNWILVFLGSGMGALGRYGLSLMLPRDLDGFPWATLSANILGCFLIGLALGLVAGKEPQRLFWIVGLLGGFTTFSAFSAESLDLLQTRGLGLVFAYIGASVCLGLLACFGGAKLVGHA